MAVKEDVTYDIVFMGDRVIRATVDGNLHPSDVQDCLGVLMNAYREAQTTGAWTPQGYQEPWMGPGGEVDSIRVVLVQEDAD